MDDFIDVKIATPEEAAWTNAGKTLQNNIMNAKIDLEMMEYDLIKVNEKIESFK